MMKTFEDLEAWFVTGSQHLYGEETLRQVAANSREIAVELDLAPGISVSVVHKRVVTSADDIYRLCLEANSNPGCVVSSPGCTRSRRRRCGFAA
jgi:L-arabinose isomerase